MYIKNLQQMHAVSPIFNANVPIFGFSRLAAVMHEYLLIRIESAFRWLSCESL